MSSMPSTTQMRYGTPVAVNEVFGPTIQGEGPHAGQRAAFLRLSGCNLACSWCDTPYSWDWARYDHARETHPTHPAALAEQIDNLRTDLLVVTGGEPLLQPRGLVGLQHELFMRGWPGTIDVETNGTRPPPGDLAVSLYVVSPKLANSGDTAKARIQVAPMRAFVNLAQDRRAVFKFVVAQPGDLYEVQAMVVEYAIPPRAVWIMPLGAGRQEHLANLEALADLAIDAGFNLTTRLHVLAWDTERRR